MGLIDLGITRDEQIVAGGQVGPGEYDAEFQGLLKNEETQGYVHVSRDKGSKMVQASFKVVNHPDPMVNGKRLPIYTGVAGSFSLSDLMEAVPGFWPQDGEPGGPDGTAGGGTVCRVTVKMGKGDYADRTQISKLKPKR